MRSIVGIFFFFNDTATTEIYTLSLHDALPISYDPDFLKNYELGFKTTWLNNHLRLNGAFFWEDWKNFQRSEEHTSELQSQSNLVCRLLLEKKTTRRTPSSAVPAATACDMLVTR